MIPIRSHVRHNPWTITHYPPSSPPTPDNFTHSTSHNIDISTHTQGPTTPAARHPPTFISFPELNPSTHSSSTNHTTDTMIYYMTLALLLAFTLSTLPLTLAFETSLYLIYVLAGFLFQLVVWPVLGLTAIYLSYPWSGSKYGHGGATDAWLEADCFPPIDHDDEDKMEDEGQNVWELLSLLGSWGWFWVIVGVWMGIWWAVCEWKWWVIGGVVLVAGMKNVVGG